MNTNTNRAATVAFTPHTDEERVAANINRMMLNYWTLRVKIQRAAELGEWISPIARMNAQAVRVQGFRAERDCNLQLSAGQTLFDDATLQKAGTTIAYLLRSSAREFARGEVELATRHLNDALKHEEITIIYQVNRALYGIDLEDMAIAA